MNMPRRHVYAKEVMPYGETKQDVAQKRKHKKSWKACICQEGMYMPRTTPEKICMMPVNFLEGMNMPRRHEYAQKACICPDCTAMSLKATRKISSTCTCLLAVDLEHPFRLSLIFVVNQDPIPLGLETGIVNQDY
jgi:hypothetical protein